MKVSARNVLPATVKSVRQGTVNAEVVMSLENGEALVATVSVESAKALGLVSGTKVMALIKASWVMLINKEEAISLSARNRLSGTVRSVRTGEVSAEVELDLTGGLTLVAVVTVRTVLDLGVRAGLPMVAVFKASHLMLALDRSPAQAFGTITR